MNAALLSAYQLLDRYDLSKQCIYINGVQTFLRMAIAQRQSDRIARINSAGFITGYRGSPVGGLDLEAWRESALLQQHDVALQPSINEDLAATAPWGTQLTTITIRPVVNRVYSAIGTVKAMALIAAPTYSGKPIFKALRNSAGLWL